MLNGLYCVIEGIEGAGKTTVTAKIGTELSKLYPDRHVRLTRHPGATPLGLHLRTLIKYPEKIDPLIQLDPISSQLLMVTDCSCFVQTVLKPAMANGEIVIADRSNTISSIAYGVADGLTFGQIDQMFRVANPPRMDRLYVLRLPWEIARSRMIKQGGGDSSGLDRFERKGDAFFHRVHSIYERLTTGPAELLMVVNHSVSLENVKFVDATRTVDEIVSEIVGDLSQFIHESAD